MRQFGKILSFELKHYLKNKLFVGITVFLVLLIAIVMCLPRITAAFEAEDTSAIQEDMITEIFPVMLVKADDPELADVVLDVFESEFYDYDVQLTDNNESDIMTQISSGEAACAFVLTGSTSFDYYVDTLSMYDMNVDTGNTAMQKIYQIKALTDSGMTQQQADEILNIVITSEIHNVNLMQNGEEEEYDPFGNFLYTYIMIFALYMVILLYGQMVTTNVATEKSSRAMEVLITSAKPTAMMFGKVLSSCIAGFVQLAVIFGSALVFYNLNKDYWGDSGIIDSIFNIPPELFAYMLVFFILGFLIYAFLFGAIGSTATKLEDINTSTMPLMFLFIIAFIVVMFSMSAGDVENTVIKVCSYIPFTSPMAMFTRIAMSAVAWYEIATSIAILVASTIGVGILSAKIYRVGVLLYGTTPKLSAILKAVWNA